MISSHSSGNLKDDSLRKVNVPFIGVRSPAMSQAGRPAAAAVVAAPILKLWVLYDLVRGPHSCSSRCVG